MKEKIIELLKGTNRDGIDDLIDWMEKNGFFTAPCSGGNHLAKEGGLAQHSLNVYELIWNQLATGLLAYKDYGIHWETIVICSLLHDLGKAGDYGKPNYVENVLKSGKVSDSKPYVTNSELAYIPHEVRSVSIAKKFIDLREEEEFAILYHNGLYGDFKYAIKDKETPLYLLLHFADMWASRVTEVDGIE